MTAAASTILQLEGIGLRNGAGAWILRDVSLTLTQGSFRFLVGPSGAGKTTLLHVMSLCQAPSAGSITLFGRDVCKLDPVSRAGLRKRLGVIFQDLRLLDHLSAFDNVALPLRIGGTPEACVARQVGEILDWLELADVMERRPGELSMGQRQLVATARAVVTRPSLLLADEPTSSMDDGRARKVMHLFCSLHRLGTAVVLATHSERLIESLPLPVLRLAHGALAAAPPPMATAAE